MPEYERDATRIALLEAYERALANDLAVSPPDGLDPELATVARRLARQLGGAVADPAATPDPAFRAALRRRLAEQAARYPAVPARSAPLANGRYGGGDAATLRPQRRASFGPRDAASATPAPEESAVGAAQEAARSAQPASSVDRRPFRAAVSTGLGWLGAALVYLIVLLATTLLLRGLPHATPAAQPTSLPAVAPLASPTPLALAPTPVAVPTRATAPPLWQPVAAMATPRAGHTATLLADGRVLVAGGLPAQLGDTRAYFASVEIYDPATGRWATVAPMGRGRVNHTATLLKDGRVLVVGGLQTGADGGELAGAEIYDPRADRWTTVAPLHEGRTSHTATLLADGRVLVVGGANYLSSPIASWEIYDPASDRWATSAYPGGLGDGSTALVLPDGRVLLVGGGTPATDDPSPTLRYDPAANAWESQSPLAPGRFSAGVAQLPDGRALVAGGAEKRVPQGGDGPVGPPLASALRYDPAADRWSPAASLATARMSATLVTLASGQILAVGGFGGEGALAGLASAERYDPAADRWVGVGQMQTVRFGHTATRLADGRVLVVGGYNSGGGTATASAELYTDGAAAAPAVATPATPAASAPLWQATGALASVRAQHSATRLADGRVLVAGGHSDTDDGATAAAELYDPRTGRWTAIRAMGAARVGHAALALPDGTVLVAGGFNNSVNHNTTSVAGAERYDPATGRWRPTAAPPVGLGLVGMDLLRDGRALVVTTSPGGTPPEARATTALLYDPATDRWSSLGAVGLAELPTVVALADGRALLLGSAGQDNDGTTPALLLDPATGATTPAPLPDARGGFSATRLADGGVLVAGGFGWTARGGGQGATLASALRFDPATASWKETATMIAPRSGQAAVALADGRVLVVGSNNGSDQEVATAELYTPQDRTWTALGAIGGRARARFAVAPLADGRAIVTGGDAGFVRSEWLAEVRLLTPPARSVAPSGPQPTPTLAVRPATPAASGVGNWSSPSAGLFFFGGRGYRHALPTLPDGSAPQAGAQVGSTLLPWQSGGVFPAGMPIYAVAGQPAEEWLAIRDGAQLVVYRRDDDTTALLAGVQVVIGTIASAGEMVCPGYGCPAAPPKAQIGTVATANRVRIERALQGRLPAGAEIEVRQMGVSGGEGDADRIATLRPRERVLLFLQPAGRQSIGDFSGGDYYWTGPGWLYGFIGDTVAPITGGVQTPLDRFEAAVREIFAAVTPRAPTDPVPTPRPVPTPTGIVPQPTAPRPNTNAAPTPTPGP